MAIKMHEAPKGDCKRCGGCCIISRMRLDESMTDIEAAFYMRRTGAIGMDKTQDGHWILTFGQCPYLSRDKRSCLIYDVRPDVCKMFPPDKNNIAPGCHYFDDSKEEEAN